MSSGKVAMLSSVEVAKLAAEMKASIGAQMKSKGRALDEILPGSEGHAAAQWNNINAREDRRVAAKNKRVRKRGKNIKARRAAEGGRGPARKLPSLPTANTAPRRSPSEMKTEAEAPVKKYRESIDQAHKNIADKKRAARKARATGSPRTVDIGLKSEYARQNAASASKKPSSSLRRGGKALAIGAGLAAAGYGAKKLYDRKKSTGAEKVAMLVSDEAAKLARRNTIHTEYSDGGERTMTPALG